ncbi:MAG: GAF domain-containing sensor histidine kinase, partial [Pseudobdellovibrionaceae bacterium]|nr:GAF domain-containing sensor histidine kinase [Pseudobdellovibrionaceae bacterium]
QRNEILIIQDTLLDQRFANNPLVTDEPKIRFYAGSPLMVQNGQALGTVCVIDRTPKTIDDMQIEALKALSHQAAHLLELRRFNQQLEIMIRMRTEELEQSNKNMREALDSRDEFLCVASHELKTPFNALKLKLQFLTHKVKKNTDRGLDFVLGDLQKVDDEINQISELIDKLLDVAALRGKGLMIGPVYFNLTDLVHRVVSRFEEQSNISGTEIRLFLDEKVEGYWDKRRIEQVLENLLSNAIDYGKGRPIIITLRKTVTKAIFDVHDHGQGISKEEQKVIFHRFEKADVSRDSKGLGLGLFIVAQIVKAHEGKLEVISEVGQGSIFTVELPLKAGASTAFC